MPILSEKEIDDYEYGIILPYHFAPAMAARYKNNKIKLIVPVPQVKIHNFSTERLSNSTSASSV